LAEISEASVKCKVLSKIGYQPSAFSYQPQKGSSKTVGSMQMAAMS